MSDIRDFYKWEIELKNGTIETKKNTFDPKDVIRVSYIPQIGFFPRHDIIFTDFKFVKRFSRAFINLDATMREYLHCVITDKFRIYIKSSNGGVLITEKDYELRI